MSSKSSWIQFGRIDGSRSKVSSLSLVRAIFSGLGGLGEGGPVAGLLEVNWVCVGEEWEAE